MKTTTWKGIEIWTDFVWKVPRAEPEQESRREMKEDKPKKERSLDSKFLEIQENWNKEVELRINKWKEDSKKYVEDQFTVMRKRLKTTLDKIADLVTLPEPSNSSPLSKSKLSTRFPDRALSGITLTEPTDEVGRMLYAALQGISKTRLIEKRAKSVESFFVQKKPEATLAQDIESAITVLKSPEVAEKSLESTKSEAVVNSSELSTFKASDYENPSASATLTQPEVESSLESATLTQPEVENRLESATLTQPEVENRLESATLTQPEVENRLESATLTQPEVESSLESATLTQPEVESSLESATLTQPEVENRLETAPLTQSKVENRLESTTLKPGEVEHPSSATMIAYEVKNSMASDKEEKPMASASTEQYPSEV